MIKNIEIFNFRLFKDLKFNMGKKITVVAGKNGVGKSNLLGMLGNSVELKKYKPIIHKRYRTEFSDIFKGSVDYDPSGSKKFKVNFTDEHFITATDYREFRVAWQDKNSRYASFGIWNFYYCISFDAISKRKQLGKHIFGFWKHFLSGWYTSHYSTIGGKKKSTHFDSYWLYHSTFRDFFSY